MQDEKTNEEKTNEKSREGERTKMDWSDKRTNERTSSALTLLHNKFSLAVRREWFSVNGYTHSLSSNSVVAHVKMRQHYAMMLH